MPKLPAIFRTAAVLIFTGSTVFSQDFDKGLEAYDAGDYSAAMQEWQPLAEQGHSSAQFSLGRMYAHGKGVPKDLTESTRWFRLAAEQGHSPAQFVLGYMFENGDGVPKDLAEAARWFRLAADQGNALAQYSLGVMYLTGEGVLKDSTEAAGWFRLASKQGHAWAQINLGKMFYAGKGVLKDAVSAHMWFNISSANGDEDAREVRELVEKEMTQEQIAEATRRARVCMASDYQDCD